MHSTHCTSCVVATLCTCQFSDNKRRQAHDAYQFFWAQDSPDGEVRADSDTWAALSCPAYNLNGNGLLIACSHTPALLIVACQIFIHPLHNYIQVSASTSLTHDLLHSADNIALYTTVVAITGCDFACAPVD